MAFDPSIQSFIDQMFEHAPRTKYERPRRRCDVCNALMSPIPRGVVQYAYYEYDRKYGNTFNWKCVCSQLCVRDYEDKYLPTRYPTIESGFVYLMQASFGYKIGESKDPETRRKQKERDIKQPVTLIHTIKAPHSVGVEKYFQYKYSHRKINIGNKEREWFNLSENQVEYVKSFTEIEAWRPYNNNKRVIVKLPFEEIT